MGYIVDDRVVVCVGVVAVDVYAVGFWNVFVMEMWLLLIVIVNLIFYLWVLAKECGNKECSGCGCLEC